MLIILPKKPVSSRSEGTWRLLRRMNQLMAQRDSSLRRTDLVAIGGEADLPRASGACRSGAFDPLLPSAANFAVMHDGGQ